MVDRQTQSLINGMMGSHQSAGVGDTHLLGTTSTSPGQTVRSTTA